MLAEILLKAGAEVNAKSRFGEIPLIHATLSVKYDIIQLLLDYGADPNMGDFGRNITASDLVRMYPKIQDMFSKASKQLLKNDREKIKENEGINNCHVCKRMEDGNKRCSGCYNVFYFSRDCQVADWTNHKTECQIIQKEYKLCHVSSKPKSLKCWYDKKLMAGILFTSKSGDRKKSHFVVKVKLIYCSFSCLWQLTQAFDL